MPNTIATFEQRAGEARVEILAALAVAREHRDEAQKFERYARVLARKYQHTDIALPD